MIKLSYISLYIYERDQSVRLERCEREGDQVDFIKKWVLNSLTSVRKEFNQNICWIEQNRNGNFLQTVYVIQILCPPFCNRHS